MVLRWTGIEGTYITQGKCLEVGGIYQDPKEEEEQDFKEAKKSFPAEEPQSSLSTDNSTTQGIRASFPHHHFFKIGLWTNVVKYREIQERVRKQKKKLN